RQAAFGRQAAGAPDPRPRRAGQEGRQPAQRALRRRAAAGLDRPGLRHPATSAGIMRLLYRINRTGTTVVMCTHDYGIVDLMRRRVIELNRGVLVRDEAQGAYATGPVPVVGAESQG